MSQTGLWRIPAYPRPYPLSKSVALPFPNISPECLWDYLSGNGVVRIMSDFQRETVEGKSLPL